MAADRELAPSKVLYADSRRQEATGDRNSGLGAQGIGDCSAPESRRVAVCSFWRQLAHGLHNLTHRTTRDREVADEVDQYFEEATAEWMTRGLSAEDARRAASLESGNIHQVKEHVRSYGWEDAVRTFLSDLRYAVRQARSSPGFTIVSTVTLALGIGASTAIFSVVKAVILDPLPFHQPNNLVHLWEGFGEERYHRGDEAYFSMVRPGNYFDWRDGSQSFDDMSAYRRRSMLLTGGQRAELVTTQDVYDRFFETLGTGASIGRTLESADYQANSGHVVVISHSMWEKRYAKDRNVIGRRITLDRELYEIVGVMPAGFFPTPAGYPELWTPHWASQKEQEDRVTWGLIIVGRLKSAVTWERAQTELDFLSARINKDHPTSERVRAIVVPMDAQLIGSSWKLLLLLSGGVALLLLIACINVANLLLARVIDREKEFAIRTALGARRRRLALQLLAESLVFTGAAGVLGLGIAAAGTRGLLVVLPRAAILPRLDSVKPDFPMLAGACSLTLLTSLFFGLIPLVRTSRHRPYDLLKLSNRSSSSGKSKRRLGRMFVVSEFVFSLVLLTVGVLLVESFLKLRLTDPGFDPSRLLVFRVPVPEVNYGKYIDGGDNPRRERLYRQLEQIVTAIPGVDSAAFTAGLPLNQEFNPWGVRIDGHAIPPSGSEGDTGIQVVNPQFLRTLGLKLVEGRFLVEQDNAETPRVAVVNQSFVQKFFPNEDPIGKRATVWYSKTTIVGVVSDFKMNALDRKPYPEIFWSIRQTPSRGVWIMARTKADPSAVAEDIRWAIQNLDSELPVLEMNPMTEVIADSLWLKRVSADLIGLVAGLALVLAATGIYSIMSYSAIQRKKEIGIRVAFGADQRNIFRLIMGETCRLALLGCALGCLAAFIVARLAISISYLAPSLASSQSHETLHPEAFIFSALFLFAVALCAGYAPARRALRIDPAAVLQQE